MMCIRTYIYRETGRASRLQGYLTHTKTHPPRTPYYMYKS